MKKLFAMAFALSGLLFFVSCDDDGDDPTGLTDAEIQQAALDAVTTAIEGVLSTDASATGADETVFDWTITKGGTYNSSATNKIVVEGNISEDTEWTNDNIYVVTKRVTVLDGVTLTINAGTRVEGDAAFSGVEASVLMIARGGTLLAEGTAAEPIIMTATSDDGTKSADVKGEWGGLVVLGKAPISAEASEVQIEGVPADDVNGLYGGSTAADNSGIIKYVSIRHGGAVIDAAAGDEINGLTLGGVGSGTVIENVEVYANSDDGIELFGGTVNITNAIVAQVGDDAIDIDQSYSGTVSNYVVMVDENSDEGLEIDGREGDALGSFTLMNGSIMAVNGASITCDFKSKALGSVTNLNANGGNIKLAASFDDALESTENAAKNVIDNTLTFTTVNATFSIYTDDLPALEGN